MKETATILEIFDKGRTATVQCHEQEACKSCNSMFCKTNERTFTAGNAKGFELHVGDDVTVYLPPGKTIQASFLLLIAPLILFFIFFILAEKVFSLEKEIFKIGVGLIGLGVGFFVTFLITKNNKHNTLPQIIKKLP